MKNLRNTSSFNFTYFSRQVKSLLTLSEDLKRAKYIGTEKPMLKINNHRHLEKHLQEHDVHLKLQRMIKVQM